jgi:hypothetical protein
MFSLYSNQSLQYRYLMLFDLMRQFSMREIHCDTHTWRGNLSSCLVVCVRVVWVWSAVSFLFIGRRAPARVMSFKHAQYVFHMLAPDSRTEFPLYALFRLYRRLSLY